MKNTFHIIPAFFLFLFSLASCSYLDIVPDNVATIDYAFTTRTVAIKFLYTCYGYRPAVGAIDTDPGMNGADETWMCYGGFFDPYQTSLLAGGGYQSVTNPLLDCWDGESGGKPLWIGIHDCNIFLENINKVPDMTDKEKKRWAAEVKFLKAYYHYCLFKRYGPIPLMDKNLPISTETDAVMVYREPVDNVVKYIADLMKEAAIDLPDAGQVSLETDAGRVDKLVALTMRAEVLLFAASPLFNGNTDYEGVVDNRGKRLFSQTYEAEKWQKAAQACKEAIGACHLQGKALYDIIPAEAELAPEPFKVQTTYREAICDRWNKELIWGGTNNDCDLLSREAQPKIVRIEMGLVESAKADWAPTLKMAGLYYSSNGVPIGEDIQWQNNGWFKNRFKVRPEPSSGNEVFYVKEGEKTAYLHYNREPRFYASLGFDKGIYFGNGYYNFPDDVKYCDFFNKHFSGRAAAENYSITGYTVKKMHSFKNIFTSNKATREYFPFPILRLADLYLMYAEALNEAYGPADEVFFYLDKVRTRAGLEGVKESWRKYSTHPEEPDSQEGLRRIIHQERTIELAFEGKRFWDIRRWKEIDVLNDQPEGWSVLGETTEDFYKVKMVARDSVRFTVKDYFWPIKESNFWVNKNLVQNYGW